MKWFKHDCDMHTNLKIQELIDRKGAEGYGVWCICLELIGKEGKKGKLDAQKRWKKGLLKVLQWSDKDKLEKILSILAELRLINPKSLSYGNLHIPEFHKRVDDWTRRQLRSNFGVTSGELPHRIDKTILDKIRLEYIRLKGWKESDLHTDDYGRIGKASKSLYFKAKENIEIVQACIKWVSERGYCDWTLETCIKKWQDFLKYLEVIQVKDKQGKEAQEKFRKMKEEAENEGLIPKEKLDNLIKQTFANKTP